MRLLGYSGLNHDSAVALLEDGKLVFACESEKIRRAKHELSPFPDEAVRRLLSATGLELHDIDSFAVNYAAGVRENWGCHSTYAKGNFQFERVVTGWRAQSVLDLRLKK
jgi:predicted NodU family carbamoyl transferase